MYNFYYYLKNLGTLWTFELVACPWSWAFKASARACPSARRMRGLIPQVSKFLVGGPHELGFGEGLGFVLCGAWLQRGLGASRFGKGVLGSTLRAGSMGVRVFV